MIIATLSVLYTPNSVVTPGSVQPSQLIYRRTFRGSDRIGLASPFAKASEDKSEAALHECRAQSRSLFLFSIAWLDLVSVRLLHGTRDDVSHSWERIWFALLQIRQEFFSNFTAEIE